MLSIEEIGAITRAIRQAAKKYMIKMYLLNCVYFAYLYNGKDESRYINRFVLGFSVSPVSIYNNTSTLVKLGLIDKVSSDVYLLTELSNNICTFINKEITR
ncbi:MAG: hypothetical protein HXX14_01770 [Bacteroidetes bacterium]|nr:hypothetical protein [Bacteroidota bacterium]